MGIRGELLRIILNLLGESRREEEDLDIPREDPISRHVSREPDKL